MTTSSGSDDPFEIHSHREPLPNAGIRIIFLTDLPEANAEALIAPLVELIRELGRPVEQRIVPITGSDMGRCVSAGLAGASLPLVLVTTALEPWTKAHLDPLLEAIDHSDHVVGRRPADGWETTKRWLASVPRRMIFAVPLLDVHSPCRIHRLEKLAAIPLQSSSSFLDIEILAKATFFGHMIADVGVPPLRGLVHSRAAWSDWHLVLRHPEFRPASGPAEEPQREHEGSDGPGNQDQERRADIGQARAFQDDAPQGADELGQGQGGDQGLDALGEPLG
jgi:hypothetical protein